MIHSVGVSMFATRYLRTSKITVSIWIRTISEHLSKNYLPAPVISQSLVRVLAIIMFTEHESEIIITMVEDISEPETDLTGVIITTTLNESIARSACAGSESRAGESPGDTSARSYVSCMRIASFIRHLFGSRQTGQA